MNDSINRRTQSSHNRKSEHQKNAMKDKDEFRKSVPQKSAEQQILEDDVDDVDCHDTTEDKDDSKIDFSEAIDVAINDLVRDKQRYEIWSIRIPLDFPIPFNQECELALTSDGKAYEFVSPEFSGDINSIDSTAEDATRNHKVLNEFSYQVIDNIDAKNSTFRIIPPQSLATTSAPNCGEFLTTSRHHIVHKHVNVVPAAVSKPFHDVDLAPSKYKAPPPAIPPGVSSFPEQYEIRKGYETRASKVASLKRRWNLPGSKINSIEATMKTQDYGIGNLHDWSSILRQQDQEVLSMKINPNTSVMKEGSEPDISGIEQYQKIVASNVVSNKALVPVHLSRNTIRDSHGISSTPKSDTATFSTTMDAVSIDGISSNYGLEKDEKKRMEKEAKRAAKKNKKEEKKAKKAS